MITHSASVQNFRCILDQVLNCASLTALVGPNGCGKSTFLRAVELFFNQSPRITPEDFYNSDITQEIRITLTFKELGSEAQTKFKLYIQDGSLAVTRVISLNDGKVVSKYYGSSPQNPDFIPVKNAGVASAILSSYRELRKKPEYSSLPAATASAGALAAMGEWENAHPDKCSRSQDSGQFFGFSEVGTGYLGDFIKLILVPAVRDASADASEGTKASITEIMNLVVRNALASRAELALLKADTKAKYEAIVNKGNMPELSNLQARLTKTLQTFAPNTSVYLDWMPSGGIDIPMPRADVKLVEDGYSAAVARTGHGLQRAFILTMLQHLAFERAPQGVSVPFQAESANVAATHGGTEISTVTVKLPHLVLVIEEPELYQHPNRQRYLANVLLALALGSVPGVAERTQILYCTHSPLFVGLDRFDEVRALRKVANGNDKPKVTIVREVRGDVVAEEIWNAAGRPEPKFTWQTLRPRLQSIMTPWTSEGFFADAAVLVEGEDDRAAILGTAQVLGHNLESRGISVIPCGGKANLDRPASIFRQFGIPTYVVFDGDKGKGKEASPEGNKRLLRLLGKPPVDYPPTQVDETFACFEVKLEQTLISELGKEKFEELLGKCLDEMGMNEKQDGMKNPMVMAEIIKRANADGCHCTTLEAIVHRALALVSNSAPAA
ncbi:MAG: AAA family ATPase [Dehalococcoidia bacterium]|nr:AAA family ATPase [Dehalococcoidia bacterium]